MGVGTPEGGSAWRMGSQSTLHAPSAGGYRIVPGATWVRMLGVLAGLVVGFLVLAIEVFLQPGTARTGGAA